MEKSLTILNVARKKRHAKTSMECIAKKNTHTHCYDNEHRVRKDESKTKTMKREHARERYLNFHRNFSFNSKWHITHILHE